MPAVTPIAKEDTLMLRTENRLKAKTMNLLLAGVSTLVMLLVFETGFRVRAHLENRGVLDSALDLGIEPPDGPADLGHMIRMTSNRRIVYELKPNLSVEYQGSRVTTNGQGFRGVEHPVERVDRTYRIVGIGDSFMFGQGVENPKLTQRRPAREWQVINTAVPGYSTVMEVEALKEKGLAYSPDLVIIEFVLNDLVMPNFMRLKEPVLSLSKSFLVDYFKKRRPKNLRKGLWRRLKDKRVGPAIRDQENPTLYASDPEQVPPEYRDMVGWDAYHSAMTDLRRLSDEHGFEVLSICLNPNEPPLKNQALTLSRELGFRVLDIGAVFRRYLDQHGYRYYLQSPLALAPTDGHPTALARGARRGVIRALNSSLRELH